MTGKEQNATFAIGSRIRFR